MKFIIISIILYIIALVLCYFIFKTAGKRRLFEDAEGTIGFIVMSLIPIVNVGLVIYSLYYALFSWLDNKNKSELNDFAANPFEKDSKNYKSKFDQ